MTNKQMADLLLKRAERIDATNAFGKSRDEVRWLSEEAKSLRAGAKALRAMNEDAKNRKGTVLITVEALREADAAQREVERLREENRLLRGLGKLSDAMRRAFDAVLNIALRYAPPPPHKGSCGPEAGCDAMCAEYATLADELRFASKLVDKSVEIAAKITPDPRDARIAELEADKARWDALEALPYQIEVTMRMERVKHPAMISLREQVDAALKRMAALKEACDDKG